MKTLHETITRLKWERQQIDKALAALETLVEVKGGAERVGRRGRKSMGPEERLEVSRRMKAFWANRRKTA